jgi:predicted NUDIX family NTP pyrophosphohydrolase
VLARPEYRIASTVSARTAQISAGLLLCRHSAELEFLLVHPGGPFFAGKDLGAWSIPKGLVEPDEVPLATAWREFEEETGFALPSRDPADYVALGEIRQKGGKRVIGFATLGDADVATLRSNPFELEWPPRSGRKQMFPEVDRAGWFGMAEAARKINVAQVELLQRALAAFASRPLG